MFVFGVLAPAQAIASIDFATLVLLFSMMLIVASLHLAGFFQWVSRAVPQSGTGVFPAQASLLKRLSHICNS
jgi:Na+/H+ antiporter NhaD/arsenite permease-like protein